MLEKGSIGRLALEVFSIVLGVLLALAVSEWQEEREKAELASAALQNVANELAANQALLEQIHENNTATVAAIDAALAEESGEDYDDMQFIPGVQVRATAWEALLTSGVANHVDYQLLLGLSETYALQAVYRQTGSQMVEATMSMAAMAAVNEVEVSIKAVQKQFDPFLRLLLGVEEALMQEYADSLGRLSEHAIMPL